MLFIDRVIFCFILSIFPPFILFVIIIIINIIINIIIISVICPRTVLSLQIQAPRLKFCPKTGLPPQTQKRSLQFYYGRIGAVAWRCFPNPTDLKISEKFSGAPTWRWEEWIWLTGPSGLHLNSQQQGFHISSIRVFGQIRDPEFIITLRPHFIHNVFII